MSHVCFVTPELPPVLPGGAGSLILNSLGVMAQRGIRASLLLDCTADQLARVQAHYRNQPLPSLHRIERIEDLAAGAPVIPAVANGCWYRYQSYRIYQALRRLCQDESFDLVEFTDYFGPGYYSCLARALGLDFAAVPLAIRLHNPWEALLVHGDAVPPEPYVSSIFAIERAALRLADRLLVSSERYWQALAPLYTTPRRGQVVLSPPALLHWPQPERPPGQDGAGYVLFFGRLQPFKGLERLIPALVAFADRHPEARFLLVGHDSTLGPGWGSYRDYLLSLIPEAWRWRFEFTGPLPHDQLARRLDQVRCAVFPNLFESFCYAAHELRQAGVPLLLSRTAAFEAAFVAETDAVFFDGSTTDLIDQLSRLWQDSGLRSRLQQAIRRPEPDDALGSVYTDPPALPEPAPAEPLGLTFVIVDDQDDHRLAAQSCTDLIPRLQIGDNAYRLSPTPAHPSHAPLTFLGRSLYARQLTGTPLAPGDALTAAGVLLLDAGDTVDAEGLDVLRHSFATATWLDVFQVWWSLTGKDRGAVVMVPADEVGPEQDLHGAQPVVRRGLYRVQAGRRLDDVFDRHAQRLGAVHRLWQADGAGALATFPRTVIHSRRQRLFHPVIENPSATAYLVANLDNQDRLRLMAFRTLTEHHQASQPRPRTHAKLWTLVKQLVRKLRRRRA